jgi:hypothetical protein
MLCHDQKLRPLLRKIETALGTRWYATHIRLRARREAATPPRRRAA